MATSSAAFKEFRKAGVVVFADSKTDGGALPKGVSDVRSAGGNTIPIVYVTNADGSKGIEGISYATLKEDMRKAVWNLKKTLASANASSDEAGGDKPPAGLLADEQAWTNAQGKSINAAVKAVDKTNVSFVMPNGTVVSYPLAKLSDESRKQIEALRK